MADWVFAHRASARRAMGQLDGAMDDCRQCLSRILHIEQGMYLRRWLLSRQWLCVCGFVCVAMCVWLCVYV